MKINLKFNSGSW